MPYLIDSNIIHIKISIRDITQIKQYIYDFISYKPTTSMQVLHYTITIMVQLINKWIPFVLKTKKIMLFVFQATLFVKPNEGEGEAAYLFNSFFPSEKSIHDFHVLWSFLS